MDNTFGQNRKNRFFGRFHLSALLLALYDFCMIHLAFFAALWFRYDCDYSAIAEYFLKPYFGIITPCAVVSTAVFLFLRLYKIVWRFAGYTEYFKTFICALIAAAIHLISITLIFKRMPLSYYLFGTVLLVFAMLFPRIIFRMAFLLKPGKSKSGETERVMLIGAGTSGQMILRNISRACGLNEKVVCMIDDDPKKCGRVIDNVPIVGGREDILRSVGKYRVTKIYLAIPSASPEDLDEITDICQKTDCEIKRLPGIRQLVLGQISFNTVKDVSVEDLLERDPIRVDMGEVFDFINGKTVMVTGGGGSIGSELCRQIADHHPSRLIIVDIYENNAYAIQLELKEKHPELDLVTLIASVRDSRRMFGIFEKYRPQIVYHAAAHKHVPLMEDSPNEAIKNNAVGTYKTAYAAMVHGCDRFVLISTDKAVNPTNIMGASKRVCEMIIQSFDAKIREGRPQDIPQMFTHYEEDEEKFTSNVGALDNVHTRFVAVRFGNVLGSNGSVIPIFKSQIEKGGPVTVTHPEIIRYFMTIPEAVSLVMLAGTYAEGGEIFVLDMGKPVKIDTLARNLIRLCGYTPDVDIKIEYTGLRPGEKLYEEKLMAEEGLKKTENDLIHIGCPIPFETDEFLHKLEKLMEAAYKNKKDIRERISDIVPTYHPADTETTKPPRDEGEEDGTGSERK